MTIGKRLAAGAAALGLAGAGLVAGAAPASANTTCVYYSTTHGATVGMCLNTFSDRSGGYLHWTVDTSRATTDERLYFTLQSGGGCSNSGDWNDYQTHSGDVWLFCDTPLRGTSYSTESGRNSSGGTHYTGWIY
ncbi:hypothetical protein ACGF07_33965 [Kitasatospora sp. NPDC048194]|uniref:hypothetical protein n=1 Tax=Kitasatospora sp. NPDC048194 TaxID=3364045 RepID=UPI00371A3238